MRTLFSIAAIVRTLLSDRVIFPLFELLLLGLCLYAVAKERRWFARGRGATLSVKRGEISWGYLNLAYGIVSVVLLQVVIVAEALEGHKTIISLVDLVILAYLTFSNSWSRNAIIGIISRFRQKWER